MKELLIRTDGGASMGYGHALRCLALAQGAVRKGVAVSIVFSELDEALQTKYRETGVTLKLLPVEPFGGEDAEFLTNQDSSWLVVDGYHFDDEFFGVLSSSKKILVLDDTGRANTLKVDSILNQNAFATEELYREVSPECKLLLGTDYALLRSEFLDGREAPEGDAHENITRVLLTVGGSDEDDLSSKLVREIAIGLSIACHLTVVIGTANRHSESLLDLCLEFPNVFAATNVENMADVLRSSDFVITGAGSTVWECLALKVPFMTMVLSSDQEPNARFLEERDLSLSAGNAGDRDFLKSVKRELNRYFSDCGAAIERAERGGQLIDCRGADRVIEFLF